MTLGAIILAGGKSSRMGTDKALIMWSGQRAVDRVVELAKASGADSVLVSGPDYGHPFLADDQLVAGPPRALVRAAQTLSAHRLLVLAVDSPLLTPADLAALLGEAGPGAIYAGHPLPMVIRRANLLAQGGAPSLRSIAKACGLAVLPVTPDLEARVRGPNTPEELAAAEANSAIAGGGEPT